MNDERNRKFAESFEPMPTIDVYRIDSASETNAWVSTGNGPPAWGCHWIPRDFTQPEGVLMLLERMKDHAVVLEGNANDGWHVGVDTLTIVHGCINVFDKSLAEAVNLAYERWMERK